jgi:amidase
MRTTWAGGLARLIQIVLLGTLIAAASPSTASPPDVTAATIEDLSRAMDKREVTSEQLVRDYLARIEAFDDRGPAINAVIALIPDAIATARSLDRERRAKGPRGLLHGIPVLVKDNIDVAGLPITVGSQLLEGNVAAHDAWVVRRLREAGAVIVAKVNLSEFAALGGSVLGAPDHLVKLGTVPNGFSSAGGQTRNPHDPERSPHNSSGGTGAAIAAAFAQVGLGTDTGGSIRGPASWNGIVGLKPTMGLVGRSGIAPLALSLDAVGPMARSVYDVAVTLGALTGVDPADPSTQASTSLTGTDYTQHLKRGALRGARIGVARDFGGVDPGTDAVYEAAVVRLRELGAEVIDPIRLPRYALEGRRGLYIELGATEFKAQITDWLKATGPGYPKSFDDLVSRANDPATGYRSPEKAVGFKFTQSIALDPADPLYRAMVGPGLASIRAAVEAAFEQYRVDVIVYPTQSRPASLINDPAPSPSSPTSLANLSGFPDLAVPAGMTPDGLPVTVSFLGRPFSEGALLGYGYDFEQATRAIRLPKHTPPLRDKRTGGGSTSMAH